MIGWKAQTIGLLRSIYTDLRLYINFFQPVLKLVGKERIDGKPSALMIRPGHLIVGDGLGHPPVEVKAHLTAQYVQLNPVRLRASIDAKVARLWKIIR